VQELKLLIFSFFISFFYFLKFLIIVVPTVVVPNPISKRVAGAIRALYEPLIPVCLSASDDDE
jgi:hypothetical protein